mgnify:CR=1 FL=1
MKVIKALLGVLISLFFMGYGLVNIFQGEFSAGIIQFIFGALVFLGGMLMIFYRKR